VLKPSQKQRRKAMNDLGRRRPYLFDGVVDGGQVTSPGRPARLRIGTMVAVTAVCLLAVAGTSALASRTPARPVAGVKAPAPVAMATPALTFANQLMVGPGVAPGFMQSGQWSGGSGGAPAYKGPGRWIAAGTPTGASASAQWSLGNPSGGQRWDQVRVHAWIPNAHALAWVRYTVTSTEGTAQSVQSFDVSQQALNGWYALPVNFRIGTSTQRTGTITVRMTYLRSYAGDANGCQMAAAQMQFEWS
jgi:hypothetical protein